MNQRTTAGRTPRQFRNRHLSLILHSSWWRRRQWWWWWR